MMGPVSRRTGNRVDPTVRRRLRLTGLLTAAAAVLALAGCGPDDGPGPDDPTSAGSPSTSPSQTPSGGTDLSADEVRRSLAELDPCALLGGSSNETISAAGPHTCSGNVSGARVTIEVGIPFDEAAREAAQPQSFAGLAAHRRPTSCQVVFAAGDSHGIAVDLDATHCGALAGVADQVGKALAEEPESLLRASGPDNFTACGLLADAVADPSTLIDQQGSAGGLDHCEDFSGSVSGRDSLGLSHTSVPFDQLTSRLGAAAETISGHDVAVVDEGQTGCFVHAYLWDAKSPGHADAHTEATVSGRTCDRARKVTAAVLTAADGEPPAGGDLAAVLVRAE